MLFFCVILFYLGGEKEEEVRIRLSKPDWIKGKYTEIQYYLHKVNIVLKALPCVYVNLAFSGGYVDFLFNLPRIHELR